MDAARRTWTAYRIGSCFFAALMLQILSGLAPAKAQPVPNKVPRAERDSAPVFESDPRDLPLAIMQQNKGAFAPGLRAVINFAKPGKECRPWHFEVAAHSDARVVFQIKEPADRGIVLAAQVDEKAYQVLLGDGACQFGVRIERIK